MAFVLRLVHVAGGTELKIAGGWPFGLNRHLDAHAPSGPKREPVATEVRWQPGVRRGRVLPFGSTAHGFVVISDWEEGQNMGPRRWYRLAATAVVAEIVGYLAWRPRMLRWGATADEAAEPLPGDDRTPNPRMQSTRAITIDAPPEEVWPWIVQMGIGRAGFYTHDWVERLMFRARYVEGRRSATTIHPELQELSVGDSVPMGAGAYAPVTAMIPPECLVAQEAFVLRRLPGGRTRLITRYRGVGYCLPTVRGIAPDAGLLPRTLRFVFLQGDRDDQGHQGPSGGEG